MTRYAELVRRRAPRALVVAALALPAFALSACSDPAAPGPQPTAGQSTQQAPPAHYEPIDDLCPHVSLDEIIKVLPHVEEGLFESESPIPGLQGYAECDAILGTEAVPDVGVFGVTIQVYEDDALANDDYDYFYETAQDENPVSDIAGLGEQAFRSLDSFGDPAVTLLDGNAVIVCNFVARFGEQPPAPESLYPALEATLHKTLASLRNA